MDEQPWRLVDVFADACSSTRLIPPEISPPTSPNQHSKHAKRKNATPRTPIGTPRTPRGTHVRPGTDNGKGGDPELRRKEFIIQDLVQDMSLDRILEMKREFDKGGGVSMPEFVKIMHQLRGITGTWDPGINKPIT